VNGNSSGVRPTARASANISDAPVAEGNVHHQDEQYHQHGQPHDQHAETAIPTAKAVAGGFSARLVARWPSAVRPPVRQIRIVAVPLIADVPAKTAFDAPAGFSAPKAASLACFSAG
jgi:hypothetical protein